MSRLLNYVPVQLSQTVEDLRSDHPERALHEVSASATILDTLRDRLRETDSKDIPALAVTLKPVELRTSLHLILEAEIKDKALELHDPAPVAT